MTVCCESYCYTKKANLKDLTAVTGLIILLKVDSYHQFFSLCGLEIRWMTSKNNRAPLIHYIKLCASFQIHQWIKTGVASKLAIFCPMWPGKNRAPCFYYIKLCVSFQSHRWIQTDVTVRKCSIRSKSVIFLSLVTLKFDGWPQWLTGHLFYTTSSFVHHFKAIGEFKLELQSGNAPFGSKSVILCPVWSWNLTDDLDK